MKLASGTKRSVLINLIGEIPSRGFLLFANIFLAHSLTLKEFGIWNILWAGFGYLLLFIDWGMAQYGVREITVKMRPAGKVVSEVISVRIKLAILLIPIIIIFSNFFRETQYYLAGNILALALVFSIFFLDWYFRAVFRFGYSSLISFFSSLAFLIILVIPVDYIKFNLEYVAVAKLISLFITFILGLWLFRRVSHTNLNWGIFKNVGKKSGLIKEGWYLATGSLFTRLYFSSDIVILALLKNENEVGIYSGVVIIYNILITIRALVVNGLFPHFGHALSNQAHLGRILKRWTGLAYMVSMGFIIVVFLKGRFILNGVLGSKYSSDDALLVLKVFSVTMFVISINLMFPSMCVLLNKTRNIQKVTLVAAVSNIGMNFILIPKFGIVGAAFTTLLAEIIVLIGAVKIVSNSYSKATAEN